MTYVIQDMEIQRRFELNEIRIRERQQEEELGVARHMAYTDSLTGVKNTHAYVEKENRETKQNIRYDRGHEGRSSQIDSL